MALATSLFKSVAKANPCSANHLKNFMKITTPQSHAKYLSSTSKMSKYFMLTYHYVPDILEKRTPVRPIHLKHVGEYVSEGKLLLGGALTDPVDSAAVIFKVDSKEVVEKFAKEDPYVLNGLVTAWNVREWTVVAGTLMEK